MSQSVTKLAYSILPPSKVVKHVNWTKKGILALDISKTHVGISYVEQPSNDRYSIPEPLIALRRETPTFQGCVDPINLTPVEKKELADFNIGLRRKEDEKIASVLQDAIDEHDVGAFIVAWPLLKNGRMGAEAGRVLHLLDHFADGDDPILHKRRPATLWQKVRDENDWMRSDELTANLLLENFVEDHWLVKGSKYKDNESQRKVVASRDKYVVDSLKSAISNDLQTKLLM